MVSEKGVYVLSDRLGSVRADSNGVTMSYFPWGEERGAGTANGRTKFAGYYRDQVGQDYAMARYYNANTGAFFSQDPGSISTAVATRPSSWNRYGYVEGDPVNFVDPKGLYQANPCALDPSQIGCDDTAYPPGSNNNSITTGDSPGGGELVAVPAKAPPCAHNLALATQALDNIVAAVGQVLAAANIPQSAINTVENDLTANENNEADVGFVGGHFNLVLSGSEISALNGPNSNIGTQISNLLLNGTDGSASGVIGLLANGPRHDVSNGTSLHSQGTNNGGIDFHLDLGNPYPDVAGAFKHFLRDWLPPRIVHNTCLDAPFTTGGGN